MEKDPLDEHPCRCHKLNLAGAMCSWCIQSMQFRKKKQTEALEELLKSLQARLTMIAAYTQKPDDLPEARKLARMIGAENEANAALKEIVEFRKPKTPE